MFARRALPRLQQPLRQYASRPFSTTELSNGIKIAYDLHEPPKESTSKNAPIVFMHGLFGSKKNNRSMSKYAPRIYTLSRHHTLTTTTGSSPAT